MPLHNLECKNCKNVFEVLVSIKDNNWQEKAKCPKCKSIDNRKLFGTFAFSFSNPLGRDRWVSDGLGHDYRYKYHMENNVIKERELASAKSHMGGTEEIYGSDLANRDLNNDAAWGEVK